MTVADPNNDDGRLNWASVVLQALPHMLTIASVAVGIAWWSGKIEERITSLERERDRDASAQAAMKADIQRELNSLGVSIQSIDGKLTALLMAQRAGAVR